MPVYIALLRGINIGPHKRMKMEKLVSSCAACGWNGAKTYIQSGNVVLQAPKTTPDSLAKKLETQILADFGFSSDVIVRSSAELRKTVEGNPLLKLRGIDPGKLHVVFLRAVPEPDAIKKLEAVIQAPDQVRVSGNEVYFYFSSGVSKSSLWKHPLDKIVKVSATMRNWNTVNQLLHLAAEFE